MINIVFAIFFAVLLTVECFLDPVRPFFLIWDTAFLMLNLFLAEKALDKK